MSCLSDTALVRYQHEVAAIFSVYSTPSLPHLASSQPMICIPKTEPQHRTEDARSIWNLQNVARVFQVILDVLP